MKAVISIGSNIGKPKENVQRALSALSHLLTNFQSSELFLTKPVGYLDQPDFINAVAIGDTEKTPTELLADLLAIEKNFGRVRDIRWGPRIIDLDLIDCGVRLSSAELELPHPRAFEREFVLAPWFSLEPDAFLTGVGPIKDLLEKLR
jgi:2-amino-4-hydroxy-6-hydroxymethyldihydropteridine diphosphokinase